MVKVTYEITDGEVRTDNFPDAEGVVAFADDAPDIIVVLKDEFPVAMYSPKSWLRVVLDETALEK